MVAVLQAAREYALTCAATIAVVRFGTNSHPIAAISGDNLPAMKHFITA
jgi:hypothetical protein